MVEKQVCQNGVRIVYEKMKHVHSVAIGIWIEAGSGNELDEEAGIAHFIEHMLFKGTANRSAREIAEQFDRIGGDINAFTSKEMTCFYATVLSNHSTTALTVMADMIFNSTFNELEIAKEKSVVLDEIAAVEDTPDDDVDERLWNLMFPDHSLGKAVLGNENTIKTFDEKKIRRFMERLYNPERMVISIAGNFDDELVACIEAQFGSFKREKSAVQEATAQPPVFHGGITKKVKDIEQAHLCIGFPGLSNHDPDIYVLSVLDSVIGGTMSSRLFQEVREERGLAYSVYSYYTAHANAGAFIIYGGTSPENAAELVSTIDAVIASVVAEGITDNELYNAKEQLKGGFLLGLESSESRMHRNGKNELLFGKHRTLDEVVARIEQVEAKDVHQMAKRIFTEPRAISLVAPAEAIGTLKF